MTAVINESLLDWFRRQPKCEWCGRKVKGGLQPHHLFARGMGGAGRLDLEINLIGLCHQCHRSHHDGNEPTRADLTAKIAAREGLLIDQVLADIHAHLRGEKHGPAGTGNHRPQLEPDLPGPAVPQPLAPAGSPGGGEEAFTAAVIELARSLGWRVAHFRKARTARGWRTAVQGDGKGFPDLVLIRRWVLIFAELKVGRNKLTPEQKEWLAALGDVPNAQVYVWKPEDMEQIREILQ